MHFFKAPKTNIFLTDHKNVQRISFNARGFHDSPPFSMGVTTNLPTTTW